MVILILAQEHYYLQNITVFTSTSLGLKQIFLIYSIEKNEMISHETVCFEVSSLGYGKMHPHQNQARARKLIIANVLESSQNSKMPPRRNWIKKTPPETMSFTTLQPALWTHLGTHSLFHMLIGLRSFLTDYNASLPFLYFNPILHHQLEI